MTMTKAEIADQVMWLLKLKNGDDTLTLEEEVEEIAFLLVSARSKAHHARLSTPRSIWRYSGCAMGLKPELDHADALEGYGKAREADAVQ